MLVSLYYWLKGYLIIQVYGFSQERFLNLCKNKGISTWKIKTDQDSYLIRILLKNIYELKPICRKTGVKIKIIKRCGLPFFMANIKKRYVFLAGMIFTLLFFLVTSIFIWEIEVYGNHIITEDVMNSFLEKQNIKPGILKRRVDCEQLVNDIRIHFDNIVWTSVSINGTDLYISVKEKNEWNQKEEYTQKGMDIVAASDGKIVKMITRSGTPMVSVGDSIHTGDILVSGTIKLEEDTKIVVPDADIWVEYILPYENEILATYSYKSYIDKPRYNFSISFRNRNFRFPEKGEDDLLEEVFTEEQYGVTIKNRKKYEWKFDSYSEVEREEILNGQLSRFCTELKSKDIEILENNMEITHYINKSVLKGTIRLIYLHKICYNEM